MGPPLGSCVVFGGVELYFPFKEENKNILSVQLAREHFLKGQE